MPDLVYLLEPHHTWNLGALVDEANRLLPEVLPGSSRAKEAITARTVRYYTSEGLLDPPEKDWREARYTGRHLLQLLVARKLLAQGHTLRTIGPELRRMDNLELLELLQQPTQVVLQPASSNPALEYLHQIRPSAQPLFLMDPHPSAPPSETLHRVRVKDGLEILVEENHPLPQSPAEWQTLLEEIRKALETLAAPGPTSRRKPVIRR
ncbi:MerR family transcriptional regulator [Meiothermus sp.]|jgi:DNA-binding transcriptional MerR regulator|uniref:MerR family transcriptional regulator n=1 Tax=Meiothermus sp. TaxID=1955249 RepID=UPI0021DC2744|nr:MerR family transcriptional regulator [Meiothermus sp.]GIW24148.1 MAG: hypothetical protein KatS3mg069_0415 [Meiothermus sp.]